MVKVHKALLLLRKLPRGKVTTYKILAEKCRTSPRAIGRIMRHNKEPEKYPCYKVIKSSGEVSYYSRGVRKKLLLLRRDGVKINKGKIDLNRYGHMFSV